MQKNVFMGEWSCEWEAESVSKEIIKDSFLEGMELRMGRRRGINSGLPKTCKALDLINYF